MKGHCYQVSTGVILSMSETAEVQDSMTFLSLSVVMRSIVCCQICSAYRSTMTLSYYAGHSDVSGRRLVDLLLQSVQQRLNRQQM